MNRWTWREIGLVIFLVLLAAGTRLYRIEAESVYFDEYGSLVFLDDAENVLDFLSDNRTYDPAMTPAYFICQYFWYHYVSSSIVGVRLLTVLFGLLMIPLLYCFGRDLYGKTAGGVAALCLALSPVHIYYSQEIKNYELFALAALLSTYTFYRLLQHSSRRWWVLHLMANLLLFWSHLFGIVLIATEGLYLCCFYWRRVRPVSLWIITNGILAIPLLIFASTVRYPPASEAPWMVAPRLRDFFADLFLDDAISRLGQIRPFMSTWAQFLPDDWAWFIAYRLCDVFDFALLVLFLISMISLALVSSGVWKRADKTVFFRHYVLLVLWFALPITILAIISHLWRPCMWARYTIYACMAMYLIVGGSIAALPRRWMKIGAAGLVFLLFAYQAMLVLHGPSREDWQSVARLIRQEAAPQDIILVENALWMKVFAYNLGDSPNQLINARNYRPVADKARLLHELALWESKPNRTSPYVWVVVLLPYSAYGPLPQMEELLKERGMQFVQWEFPGMCHIIVYKTRSLSEEQRRALGYPELPPDSPENVHTFTEFSDKYWKQGAYEKAVFLARRAIKANPRHAPAFYTLGVVLRSLEQFNEAQEAFLQAINLDKNMVWAYFGLGHMLVDQDKFDAAIPYLEKGLALKPDDVFALQQLGYARLTQKEYEEAIRTFTQAQALKPKDLQSYIGLGLAIMEQGEADAFKHLQTVCDTAPAAMQYYIPYFKACYVEKDPEKLEDAWRSIYEKALPLPRQLRRFCAAIQ